MIAKIVIGSNFSGVVNYLLNEDKNAEIIDCEGVRIKDKSSVIDSFNTQLKMNPNVKKAVYHISLDFSVQDINKLTNENMSEIARDYMSRMNIHDTQFIAVRHYDKEHPHIHLCINRIDNNGQIITNKNDRYRSIEACKQLTCENEFYYAQTKENVKRHRLKEPDKTKYEMYDALQQCIPVSTDWSELIINLKQKGIETTFKYKGTSSHVEGVKFSKNGYHFNGSKIDRQLSFLKISQSLNKKFKAEQSDFPVKRKDNYLPKSIIQIPIISLLGGNSLFGAEENEQERQQSRKKKKRKL
jgi:Relaxase/Mobilisation nuclease domain.